MNRTSSPGLVGSNSNGNTLDEDPNRVSDDSRCARHSSRDFGSGVEHERAAFITNHISVARSTIGNMMDTSRLTRLEEDGQNIVEYALILAVILVVVAGSAWLIVHAIIGQ